MKYRPYYKLFQLFFLTALAQKQQHDYREANNGPVCEDFKDGVGLWDVDPRPGPTYYNSAEQIDDDGLFFNEKYENNMRVRSVQCCSDPETSIVTGFKLEFRSLDKDFVD